MPELVIRILNEDDSTHSDTVVSVPVESVPKAASEEDAAMRFADWARKKSPLPIERVVRRGARVLVEVKRVAPT